MHKRPDGYHEIASLFQAIDLFDRLFFDWSTQDEVTCSDPSIPCDSSNLVSKAIALFRTHFPISNVKVHIEKKIPIQAGLGGGSSNAATTLFGLNELFGRPATYAQLINMGAQIGSDVAFFFSSGTSYCTGRGEILEPYKLPSPLKGFLAKPDYGLSTPLVYKNTSIAQLPKRNPRQALQSYPCFFNDLEIPSFQLEPRLMLLKTELEKQFKQVVMTGSGTAFFCLEGKPQPLNSVRFYPFQSVQRTHWY